ncbi:MAG: hypothetical protein KKB37_08470 [Alphaproteobacteria bacterium]|nr:hypothetical protein [Alphaproteobacteria bacterium]
MPTSYREINSDGTPSIELRIATSQPIELLHLINALTGIANQFDAYVKREHPELDGATTLYVREIRNGSTIIDLVPMIAPLISDMNTVLIIDGFIRRFATVIDGYASGQRDDDLKRPAIVDFNNTVRAIATDPDAIVQISSAEYHRTKTTERAVYEFDTSKARAAQQLLERHRIELDLPAHELFENVLMRFFQSNLRDGEPGKRTGERVIIEQVHPKDLAVTYETDLVQERIKHETTQGERNIYKIGFLVDCYLQKTNGKPALYRITNIRQVFDLPDD